MPAEYVTIAEWSESPFTSYDRRGQTVDHRVRVKDYGDFADVIHERLMPERATDWRTVEVVELRDHGMTHRKVRDGVMSE